MRLALHSRAHRPRARPSPPRNVRRSIEDWIAKRVAERTAEHDRLRVAVDGRIADLAKMEQLRAKLWASYERTLEERSDLAHLALEAVDRKDRQMQAQVRAIEEAEAALGEWKAPPDLGAIKAYYDSLVDAIEEKVEGAASVRDLRDKLTTVIAGIWMASTVGSSSPTFTSELARTAMRSSGSGNSTTSRSSS